MGPLIRLWVAVRFRGMSDAAERLRHAIKMSQEEAAREAAANAEAVARQRSTESAQQDLEQRAHRERAELANVFLDTMAAAGNPGIRKCRFRRHRPMPYFRLKVKLEGAVGWVIKEDGGFTSGWAVLLDGRVVLCYGTFASDTIMLSTTDDGFGLDPVPLDIDLAPSLAATLARYSLEPIARADAAAAARR